MKNWILIGLVIGIVAVGSFWGGMQFSGKNGVSGNLPGANFNGQMGQNGLKAGAGFAQRNGGNMLNGEILSKDDQSITLKLRDGGSQIVFISKTTTISKMTEAASTDLVAGKNVVVNGASNSDGTINAQSIQLRSDLPLAAGVNGNTKK